jgi:type IV pilus assembly protein PilE
MIAKVQGRGFTLIELMIVVVIIGVLAGIAYPTYRKHAKQTRRSDAQVALTQIANLQERFFTQCNYYAQTLAGARGCGANSASGILGSAAAGQAVLSPDRHYVITMVAPDGGCPTTRCYKLQASPATSADTAGTLKGTGLQVNDGTFRIESTGGKTWAKDGTNYNYKWTDK